MRHTYVVTYDICDPKRLRKVYRLMLGWGRCKTMTKNVRRDLLVQPGVLSGAFQRVARDLGV